MSTWTTKDIVERLDEWSGGLPNGEHKDILVAAADKLDELVAELNRFRLQMEREQMDWLGLKLK